MKNSPNCSGERSLPLHLWTSTSRRSRWRVGLAMHAGSKCLRYSRNSTAAFAWAMCAPRSAWVQISSLYRGISTCLMTWSQNQFALWPRYSYLASAIRPSLRLIRRSSFTITSINSCLQGGNCISSTTFSDATRNYKSSIKKALQGIKTCS